PGQVCAKTGLEPFQFLANNLPARSTPFSFTSKKVIVKASPNHPHTVPGWLSLSRTPRAWMGEGGSVAAEFASCSCNLPPKSTKRVRVRVREDICLLAQ